MAVRNHKLQCHAVHFRFQRRREYLLHYCHFTSRKSLTHVCLPQITIFYADLKNILLCISAFFSASTLCMQLTILSTAVVFILEVSFFVLVPLLQRLIQGSLRTCSILSWIKTPFRNGLTLTTPITWNGFFSLPIQHRGSASRRQRNTGNGSLITVRTAATTRTHPTMGLIQVDLSSHKIFLLDFYPTFMLKVLVVLGKFLLNFGLKNLLSVS